MKVLEQLLEGHAALFDALEADRVEIVVVGGVAMYVTAPPDDSDPDPLALDPARLARLPRGTNDVDIVVGENQIGELHRRLDELGYEREEDRWRRRREGRGPARLDVLTAGAGPKRLGDVSMGLDVVFDERTSITVGERRLMVATPAALAVLKCIAYGDRHEPKDLVDLARLALLDGNVRNGQIGREMRALFPRLDPRVRGSFARCRDAFATMNSPGPSAFASDVRAHFGRDDWELYEDTIREWVCRDASAMLALE